MTQYKEQKDGAVNGTLLSPAFAALFRTRSPHNQRIQVLSLLFLRFNFLNYGRKIGYILCECDGERMFASTISGCHTSSGFVHSSFGSN
jgi:hypothetical protein